MASNPEDIIGLDSDILAQLNSPESRTLLDTIDGLRELQIGETISLPEIIVVGDQSSGKSSVLEAISRVRFPVDEDVCTRFATELVLRRENMAKVNVSIQFADRPATLNDAGDFPLPFRRTSSDLNALPEFIKEAKGHMGIGKDEFSKDILRVEVFKPDIYPLTLVDLPGFYHSSTAEQSLKGKEIVDQLAERYMKKEKSIILAVVAANNNLAMQTVVREAKRHDPKRERTLGVITKPDLAGRGANERKFIDLAKGLETENKLSLGWFVLRNRTEEEKDLGFDERDLNEQKFFQSGNWSSIRSTNLGIENLRTKLARVLLDHIKTSLPSLIQEIDTNLRRRKGELKQLGRQRSTPEELRIYLLDIAETFQRLARDALEGRYSDSFFGDIYQGDRKLRAQLRSLNSAFDVILSKKGKAYEIEWSDDEEDDDTYDISQAGEDDSDEDDACPEYLQPFVEKYDAFQEPESIGQSDLNAKIESLAASNRGKELPGTANSNLALQFFKVQAKPWEGIAQFHLDLVLDCTKEFVELLFEHIVGGDTSTVAAILGNCVDPAFDASRDALEAKLRELLQPYKYGYGLPLETQFQNKLSKTTLSRLAGQLSGILQEGYPEVFEDRPRKGLSRQKIIQAILRTDDLRGSKFGTENVIDMMVTYYEMSCRTFTENVINLAVESCLVCSIPDILTPGKVYKMSKDELEALAAESADVQADRKILERQVKTLEEALKKCRQNRPRETQAHPSIAVSSPLNKTSRAGSRNATPSPAPSVSKARPWIAVSSLTETTSRTESRNATPSPTPSFSTARPPSIFAASSFAPPTSTPQASAPFSLFATPSATSPAGKTTHTTGPFGGAGVSSGGLFGKPASRSSSAKSSISDNFDFNTEPAFDYSSGSDTKSIFADNSGSGTKSIFADNSGFGTAPGSVASLFSKS